MTTAELADNYTRTLASQNVILLTTAGSHVLGLSTAMSDYDELGVFIESLDNIAGFRPTDTIVYRTADDRSGTANTRSMPQDRDVTLYGLRKYLKLALGGNPNILTALFTPANACPSLKTVGIDLQALAPTIVSRQAGNAYLGYLHSQRLRLQGSQGQKRVIRREVEDVLGFDAVYAMHMLRLGFQGQELLETGRLSLPMRTSQQSYLTQVRNGEFTVDECLREGQNMEDNIRRLIDVSDLPVTPDWAAVETWMVDAYRESWRQ